MRLFEFVLRLAPYRNGASSRNSYSAENDGTAIGVGTGIANRQQSTCVSLLNGKRILGEQQEATKSAFKPVDSNCGAVPGSAPPEITIRHFRSTRRGRCGQEA